MPISDPAGLAAFVGDLLRKNKLSIATAESLTSGAVASCLGAAPQASQWFAGGVIAYSEHVKFGLLEVRPGPVICASCAQEMATGVRRLLKTDLGVALTGVGGPDPVEDQPVGTVFIAVADEGSQRVVEHRFNGAPEEVIAQAVQAALLMVRDQLVSMTSSNGGW